MSAAFLVLFQLNLMVRQRQLCGKWKQTVDTKHCNFREKIRNPQHSLEGTVLIAMIIFGAITGRCYTPGDTDTQKRKLSFADQIAFHQKNPRSPLW